MLVDGGEGGQISHFEPPEKAYFTKLLNLFYRMLFCYVKEFSRDWHSFANKKGLPKNNGQPLF